MNKSQRNVLLVIGGLVLVAMIFYTGFATGSNPRFRTWTNFIYRNMMGSFSSEGDQPYSGYGMMGESYGGMMGGTYGGMMGSYRTDAFPLSLEEAQTAVENYLANLDIEGLSLGEIMIFDNHAYAQVVETQNGIGAFELLINPITRVAYPEYGPNMMWNLKYNLMGAGMMDSGYGMMNTMMGGGDGMVGDFNEPTVFDNVSANMAVSPDEAISLADDYLMNALPGYTAGEAADAFYGYYTLHILKDGEITGMLSVNGLNGRIFLHAWHGNFIEMSQE